MVFLLRPTLRPLLFAGSASLVLFPTLLRPFFTRPLQCDALSTSKDYFRSYESEAKVPVVKDGRINRDAFRQISTGSIVGLIGGLAVGTFSRTLAFLIGLIVVGVQYASSQGYNIVPTGRIQRYVKGINLRSLIEDNVAWKASFGMTFMLAAFAKFD